MEENISSNKFSALVHPHHLLSVGAQLIIFCSQCHGLSSVEYANKNALKQLDMSAVKSYGAWHT